MELVLFQCCKCVPFDSRETDDSLAWEEGKLVFYGKE